MAELETAFTRDEVTVSLIKGDKGIFDVKLDGELVYSKFETGHFPRLREIQDLIKPRL